MKRPDPSETWPKSWQESYFYDLQEVYGGDSCRGYCAAYANRRRHTLQLVTEVLAPGAKILDLAAAQGNFSIALAEMGYNVTWNDLRAELADYVRLKHEHGSIDYAPGDAFGLNLASRFDGLLITEIVEHVAHPDDFLAKAATLVRPGGYIIMTTPNGGYFRNHLPKFADCPDPAVYETVQFKPNADGHIFLLHTDEIEGLAARSGLEIEKLELFTNPLTHGHIKLEFVLRFLPMRVVQSIEDVSQKLPLPMREKLLAQMAVRFRRSRHSSSASA